MFVNYAHRGASSYAPENTAASFRKGIELGANGTELDLQRTKDGKIVIFHDETINSKSSGTGKISDHTYDELLNMDFGSWFDKKFAGEKIVLFEDFCKEFLSENLTFAIELKCSGIEEDALRIIYKYKRHDCIYITSFSFEALENVRKLDENIKIGWLVEKINPQNIDKLLRIRGNQICPDAAKVTREDVDLAKKYGLEVRLWGVVNEEIMKKTYSLGIEGMTVNFPDKLKKLLDGNK